MNNKTESLRLLVIDESHISSEKLTDLLKAERIPTRIQTLDDQEELEKALRHSWDVVLFISAYDLKYEQVIHLIRENDVDLPLILILNDPALFDLQQAESPTHPIMQAYKAGVASVVLTDCWQKLIHNIRRELRDLGSRRQQRQLEVMLSDAERRSQLLIKHSRSAVSYIQEGVHIFANESYLELFGYQTLDELIGMPVIDLVDSKDLQAFKEFLKNYNKVGQKIADFNFSGIRADGSSFEAMLQIGPASYEGEPCIQVIIQHQEKVDTQHMEAQLAAVSRLDSLTQLSNRKAFEEELENTRDAAIKMKQQYALLFCSIDNIGQVSASTGIAGSDAVVQKVARTLETKLPNAQHFRFGDSTFTSLVPHVAPEMITEQARAVTEHIAKELINIGNRTLQTTISIGIAMIGETSPSSEELLSRAFSSLDKVKLLTHGLGNSVNLYNPAENASESEQALRELLDNALEKGNFKLMFQAVYDTQDEKSPLFEVFSRLPLGDGKVMPPEEFMPVAHRYGMESRLDRWMLLNACKRLKSQLTSHPHTRLIINLSADSLQDSSLPTFVGKLVTALGGPANRPLTLQFAEKDINNYLSLARENIARFREQGCLVSVNNFGSSLNSLGVLDHLQLDLVKIDKSFVQDLAQEANVEAVKKITAGANAHHAQVMIAYIENATAMSKAWSLGARYLQGYYLQMPNEDMIFEAE